VQSDPARSAWADQFAKPIVIRKALAYDASGALLASVDATRADESEKRLDTVKPDAYLEPDAPPAPPPAPPAAAPDAPPAGMADEPADGKAPVDAPPK
jgi:hypothetical protein